MLVIEPGWAWDAEAGLRQGVHVIVQDGRIAAAIRQVATAPDFREALRPVGYDPMASASPVAAAQMIRDETPRWRRLVEISGAKVE
jgi:hypothetical protein